MRSALPNKANATEAQLLTPCRTPRIPGAFLHSKIILLHRRAIYGLNNLLILFFIYKNDYTIGP